MASFIIWGMMLVRRFRASRSLSLCEYAYALMNPRQTERYENGDEVDLGFELQGGGRFRINICQQRGNPRMVCRYIPEVIRNIQDLSVPSAVEELTQNHRGLILVTGTTGSGKSTTLAAMIDHIAAADPATLLRLKIPSSSFSRTAKASSPSAKSEWIRGTLFRR